MTQHESKQKHSFSRLWIVALSVLLVVMIGVTGALFVENYRRLDDSIQKERVSAGSEIGNMVVAKVEMLRRTYYTLVESAANTLTASRVSTGEKVRALFEAPENYFLIDSKGLMRDLSGNTILLDHTQLFRSLQTEDTVSTFLTIQSKGEYWLFARRLEGVQVDGREIVALVMMVSSQNYAQVAAVPLYDGLGASYVVDSTGTIMLRPEGGRGEVAFKGYNIITSLERDGASQAGIDAIRTALSEGESIEISERINGIQWLIQLFPSEGTRNIAITIPTSLTAEETFVRMKNSTLYSGLIVLALVVLIVLWLLYLFQRSQALEAVRAKAEAKSDFMSKMSHDIRTPLSAIIGMHQLALESAGEPAVVMDCLQKAKVTGEYLVSLINDMLDMSRIESGRMTLAHRPFSMEELLTHIHQMEGNFAAEKQITFEVRYDTPVVGDFAGDAVRIRQCLMNLVSNAIKFTPAGGSVTLSYEEAPLDAQHAQVILTVEDTGVGMSEDFLRRIFTPFEQEYSSLTSEYKGSGLGLSIVHNLVALMDGTITVESALHKGSRFRMTVPLETVAKQKVVTESTDLLSALRGVRILLAEDHPLNRCMASKLLTMLGLEVDEAENGQVALQSFLNAPKGYYTLILMDINMPVMDGLEASKTIRASQHPDAKTIPIIALSANAYEEDIQRSVQAGMNAHLAKPISMDEVKRILLQAVAKEEFGV